MIAVVSVAVCAAAYGGDLAWSTSVAANSSWWITQGFSVQLHGLGQRRVFDMLVAICVGRHSLNEKQS